MGNSPYCWMYKFYCREFSFREFPIFMDFLKTFWALPHIVGFQKFPIFLDFENFTSFVGFKINFFLQNGEFWNYVNSALPHIVGSQYTSPFRRNSSVLNYYNLGNFIQIWNKPKRPSLIKLKWQVIGDGNFDITKKPSIPHIVGFRIIFFLQNGEFWKNAQATLPHIVVF